MLRFDKLEEFVNRQSSSDDTRSALLAALESVVPQRREQPYFYPEEMPKLRDVSEWIVHAFRTRTSWVARVPMMPDLDMLWNAAKAAKADNGGSLSPPLADGDELEIFRFADGVHSAVRLATWEAVNRESGRMRALPHTEGVFEDGDLESGKLGLVALRDGENTVALVGINRLAVCGVVTWDGHAPDRRTLVKLIMPLVEGLGLSPMKVDSIPGAVLAADGMIYDLCEMPDGITIDGDLYIHAKCPELSRLPEDMTVNGQLVIWNNQNLRELPRNLVVTEGLGITGCGNLEAVRSGVTCKVFSSLAGCRKLAVFEEGCDFSGGVDLPDNEAMRARFPNFQRRGDSISAVVVPNAPAVPKSLAAIAGKISRAMSEVKAAVEPMATRTKARASLSDILGDYRRSQDERLLAAQAMMDAEIERRNSQTSGSGPMPG